MAAARILVVDDEPDIRELIGEILTEEGFEASLAADGAQAREARTQLNPDLILLDVWMPDIDGVSLLKEWRDADLLDCPVVMISGHGSVEAAVEATRLGAFDFIEKPLSLAKLMVTIRNALDAGQAERERDASRPRPPPVQEPIGRSPAIQALRERMERIAAHDNPVLIIGEAGTGKESAARWIHAHSRRAGMPFHVLSTRQDEAGMRKALFGSEDSTGFLAKAQGGAIFLDDVKRLDRAGQSLLLQILETGRLVPDDPASPELDVRWLAATTAGLEKPVRTGQFDESLYYRLAVLPLEVPTLRQRPEDIPDLVRFYAEYFPGRDGVPYRHFPVAVQNRLRQYTWPGNLTELKNLVQRLLILGRDDEVALAEVEAALSETEMEIQPVSERSPPLFNLPLREAREEFERQYLIYKLKGVGGSVGQLAEVVEMERTHLYRKLRQLGVDPKQVVKEK